ncbi:hypothetical protein CR513_36951, partial [Mucuna pruriens]
MILMHICLWSSRLKQFHYPSQAEQSYALVWKKLKGDVEIARSFSALIKGEQVFSFIQLATPKKYRDPRTFIVPCTIGECNFTDAMFHLGASINIMLSSLYKSLKFGDLEPTIIIIQWKNISIAHPLGIL